MHIADHTSLKNDGIGVPKVRSVSAIHDILIRGEPSYQSEMSKPSLNQDSLDIPIVYISSIPTKNELNRLTELTFKTFL